MLGPRRSSSRGFTLLELMVVITIIGLLSTVVVVSTGGLPPKARAAKVQQDLRNMLQVAEAMHAETGRWPESIEELARNKEAALRLEGIQKDPWGGDYIYDISSGSPTVTCLGADGQPGGQGEAADRTLPRPEEG
jgi:general secretion pathway protein G